MQMRCRRVPLSARLRVAARERRSVRLAVSGNDRRRHAAAVADGNTVLPGPRPKLRTAHLRPSAGGPPAAGAWTSGGSPTSTMPSRPSARAGRGRGQDDAGIFRRDGQGNAVGGPDDPQNVLQRLGGVNADLHLLSGSIGRVRECSVLSAFHDAAGSVEPCRCPLPVKGGVTISQRARWRACRIFLRPLEADHDDAYSASAQATPQ